MRIDCKHCHTGADKGRSAAVPWANVCMNCHRYVTAPIVDVKAENDLASRENQKLRRLVPFVLQMVYDAPGPAARLNSDPMKSTKPIQWIKVYTLSHFLYPNHSAHVNAEVKC